MATLNPQIKLVLQENKINVSLGTLALLGIYHKLDIETICPEEVIKAINLTKIVERDYDSTGVNAIKWNLPLYDNEEHNFAWVEDWYKPFGKKNPARRGTYQDCTKRMKEFFAQFPQYRINDVYEARDEYFKTVADPQFLKLPEKFIFEGQGTSKKSMLLQWCQYVVEKRGKTDTTDTNVFKGIMHRG